MLSDQLSSTDAHLPIDLTAFLIASRQILLLLLSNLLAPFFKVHEQFLVDNFTVYKSLRLVKQTSSGPDPIQGTV